MDNTNLQKFFEEVKESFSKAIGTSSSINEERDERNVENYVRDGGNTMTNTTEPDPQGDLAINKSFPSGGEKLISQETRPTDGVSVSDAPNNPGIVPNNETFTSSATSAIAPSKTDEVNSPTTENIAKGDVSKCASCGQSLPVAKAADVESPAEDAEETPADEKKEEMKKNFSSVWNGAFAPIK